MHSQYTPSYCVCEKKVVILHRQLNDTNIKNAYRGALILLQ